jgi:HEAT repeat protein
MLLREYSRRVGEGDDAGRELFRRVAVEDQDPNVRAEAITLIGRRGDQRDAELLERICQNEEQLPIRQRAIVSYAETGKDRSLPYLEGLARDTAQALPIRASAVLAIGRVGGDQALRALDTLAQTDPDQEIRTRAQRLAASLRTRAQAERDTPIDTDPVRVIPGAPGVNNVDKMR